MAQKRAESILMTKERLILFVKNPELGKVKTRLAKSIGDEKALAIYFKLLSNAHEMTESLSCDVAIYYSKYIDSEDYWDNKKYKKYIQQGETLGDKMHNAIADSLALGYVKVSLVGSDIYDLNADIINDSFKKLDTADVVLGPAEDGGYYLVGMKRPNKDIFNLKEWSTTEVYNETVALIQQAGLTYTTTEVLNDIDNLDDLKRTKLYRFIE